MKKKNQYQPRTCIFLLCKTLECMCKNMKINIDIDMQVLEKYIYKCESLQAIHIACGCQCQFTTDIVY